jgi:hypothetical protein
LRPAGVNNALKNGTALLLKPGDVIETELTAVAYQAEGIKRIRQDGVVE